MNQKFKLVVSGTERVMIVAALMQFGVEGDIIQQLAKRLAFEVLDPANDGPEVAILGDTPYILSVPRS